MHRIIISHTYPSYIHLELSGGLLLTRWSGPPARWVRIQQGISSSSMAGLNTTIYASDTRHGMDEWNTNNKHGNGIRSLPAKKLFAGSIEVCPLILQILRERPDQVDHDLYKALRDEFQKFYRWNYGLSTREGYLDHILLESKYLRSIVLTLISRWVTSVCKSKHLP